MLLLSLWACRTEPETPPPPSESPPSCQPLDLPTCGPGDKIPHVGGCTGLYANEFVSRVTCYAGPDPTVECGADPCPTFLERVAESGMLEPDFENGTWDRWPPGTPDTGSFDQVWANEIWAFWCKTGDDRRFDKFTDVTRVTMHPMGVDGEFEEVWERGRIDVFDESGMLVGTSRFGQVCCDGEVADRAWWGEPNQATEPGCVGDHCCVEWFTYQQEELLQMAEAARRRTP